MPLNVCVCVCVVMQPRLPLDTSNELTFTLYTFQICFISISPTFAPPPAEHFIISLLPQTLPHLSDHPLSETDQSWTIEVTESH